jgi:hypothetical protein
MKMSMNSLYLNSPFRVHPHYLSSLQGSRFAYIYTSLSTEDQSSTG